LRAAGASRFERADQAAGGPHSPLPELLDEQILVMRDQFLPVGIRHEVENPLLGRFRDAHIAGVEKRADAGKSVCDPAGSNGGDIAQDRRRPVVPAEIRGEEKQVDAETETMGQAPRHHVAHIDWMHADACCNRLAARLRASSGAIARRHQKTTQKSLCVRRRAAAKTAMSVNGRW